MSAWLLAIAGGSFWVGILLAGLDPSGPSPPVAAGLLAVGLLVLLTGSAAAWRRGGLRGGALWVAVPISFGLLGAGWASLREIRVGSSPLAALAGHLVRVDGALLSDPQSSPLGWTASVRTDLVVPIVLTSVG